MLNNKRLNLINIAAIYIQVLFIFNFFYKKIDILYFPLYLLPGIFFFLFYIIGKKFSNFYLSKLLSISLFVSLFLANFYVLITEKNQLNIIEKKREDNKNFYQTFLPRPFIAENSNEFIEKNFKINGKAYIPLSDVSKSEVIYCSEDEGWTIYKSDSKGFHNPKNIWASYETGGLVLLGDSWIHGACVPSQNNLSSVIRSKFQNVISLGRGGNGPLLNLAILYEFGLSRKPDKVIWFHSDNDLVDLNIEKNNKVLKNYLNSNQKLNLINNTKKIDEDLKTFLNKRIEFKKNNTNLIKEIYYIFSLHKLINKILSHKIERSFVNRLVSQNDYDSLSHLDFKLFEKIILKARNISKKNNIEFYFVINPFISDKGYLDPFLSSKENVKKYHENLISILKRNNIQFLDLNTKIEKIKKISEFISKPGYYGHPNSKGYKLWGDHINQFLININ